MLSLLYLRVKTQQYFESLRYMFLDETPCLKFGLISGLTLIIFRGTGPRNTFKVAAYSEV